LPSSRRLDFIFSALRHFHDAVNLYFEHFG
jgi:hypothetical protein